MRKILLLVFVLCLIVSFSANALSLGITPGRSTFDFESMAQKDIEVIIINSQKEDMDLKISVQGELKDIITLSGDSLKMSASEEEKKFKFKINMPKNLGPGLHTGEVVVTQKSSADDVKAATINAELAVATQISVYVPYPGKYIDAQIAVSGNEKKKSFSVAMINRGDEKIEKVGGELVIYDSLQKEIKRIKTNSISLTPSERGQVNADWDVNVPIGRYNAKAVLNYDGKEMYVEKDFEVGENLLDLLQVFVKDFKLGGIAKFNMVVKNKWNEPIDNAYAEMRVFDGQMNELADVKSATYSIPAGMQTTMAYYWDTKDIQAGLYNANIIMYYGEKKTQQDLKLDVGQDKIDVIGLGYVISSESTGNSSSLVTILSIIIGFLVLLNVLWFLVLRKKKLKEKK